MDNLLLCTTQAPLVTSIYNTFIEDYMPSANGSYVKVYLYLAKCLQSGEYSLSVSSLADLLENTEADIMRALLYWEKKSLLHIRRNPSTGDISGLEMLLPASSRTTDISYEETATATTVSSSASGSTASGTNSVASNIPVSDSTVSATAVSDRDFSPETFPQETTPQPKQVLTTPQDITVSPKQAQALAQDNDFIWLCNVVESYLDRPMKPNEVQLISYLYGTLHFSQDLLLHLYDYCISMGKTNSNYIQTVALSWHEQGITTPKEAQSASVRYHASYNSVSKALALGRSLAEIEKKYVDKWQNQWGFDLGVITEACDRTVLKLHHADFKYTDGILSRWHEDGVHTLQDVEYSDAQYARKQESTPVKPHGNKKSGSFQNFNQREVTGEELKELERKLLMQ